MKTRELFPRKNGFSDERVDKTDMTQSRGFRKCDEGRQTKRTISIHQTKFKSFEERELDGVHHGALKIRTR
jgi:hypothetical protein